MNRRMTMVTAIVALALIGLGGCGKSDDPKDPPASSKTTTTAAPTPSEPADAASELVGDWHDVDAKWVVHFHEDGTYVEDFEGVTDFRVGTYTVDGSTVSLVGDDGNTDKGTVEDETLVFKLGTLTRM